MSYTCIPSGLQYEYSLQANVHMFNCEVSADVKREIYS